jgi:hypothetical protein
MGSMCRAERARRTRRSPSTSTCSSSKPASLQGLEVATDGPRRDLQLARRVIDANALGRSLEELVQAKQPHRLGVLSRRAAR